LGPTDGCGDGVKCEKKLCVCEGGVTWGGTGNGNSMEPNKELEKANISHYIDGPGPKKKKKKTIKRVGFPVVERAEKKANSGGKKTK